MKATFQDHRQCLSYSEELICMKTAQRSKPSDVFNAAGKGLLSLTVLDGQLSSILLLFSF